MKINNKLTILFALVAIGYTLLANSASAATNIDSASKWAWNDAVGWMDFAVTDTVTVSATAVTGVVRTLQIGDIALDCVSAGGCAVGNWGVAHDGAGNLSGWAWNDAVGWISFSGASYQVTINTGTGDFLGWAWNDVIGWISMNCANVIGSCTASPYKVKSSWVGGPPPPDGGGPGGFDSGAWLVSSIFNTQVSGGAAFNTIMWQGSQPAGTSVGFQVASSNSSTGPWNYIGPDGTSTSVYQPNQNVQMRLSRLHHNNKQYIRYKLWLNWAGTSAPRVDDVIISYSP